jgi:hypothetical protein
MASKWTWVAVGLGVVVLAAGAFSQMRRVEEPKYVSVELVGSFELRDYPALLVAEATVKGEREVAINQGFRLIADYIFGNNIAAEKVAMTAPVTQQASETVAMTAPVTQQAAGDAWTVRFIMPSKYTMETLPKPKNAEVTLKQIDGQRVLALRFSGSTNDEMLKAKTAELSAEISKRGLSPLADATYAFYDPPWTLPFLRRNEVMIAVSK